MEESLNKNQQGVPEEKEQLKIKILLAEDGIVNRTVATEMLEVLGYSVEAVEDGKKLLDRLATAQSGEFSLIITDNLMPVMGGMEVIEKIRSDSNSNFNKLPVILFSGTLDPEIKQRVNELGGLCLAKPAKMEQMSKTVEEALSKSA